MKRLFCIVFLVVVMAYFSNALAVSPASMEIDFSPEATYNISLRVTNNGESPIEVRLSFDGEMKNYLLLSDPTKETIPIASLASKFVNIMIKLPQVLEKAGKRVASITISETQASAGAVSVLTSITVPISINVPYPGKYAELTVSANDISQHEKPTFDIVIKNLGKEVINSLIGHIEVLDNNKIIESLVSSAISTKPQNTDKLSLRSSMKYQSGEYKVFAYADYDGLKTPRENTVLRVGSLFINITDYTKELEQDKTNRFSIKIKNLWNKQILHRLTFRQRIPRF